MKRTPLPLDGEVHIWCLSLCHSPSECARYRQFLSPYEIERAARLKNVQAQSRYIAGRGMLREIVGNYLDSTPAHVNLATGENGKPFLAEHSGKLSFNLSHAGDHLIVAIASGIAVGVDIERIDDDRPLRDMARLVFSRREQEEWFHLSSSPRLQIDSFYRCWVRKEACLKAFGSGFAIHATSFDVTPLDVTMPPRHVHCAGTSWLVQDIGAPHDYCAALAVEAVKTFDIRIIRLT